jgi:tetratricopeptide (TPR) repeat protein
MTASHSLRLICLALGLLCFFSSPMEARAQSAEEEAANVLYTDGKTAFERGRHGQALNLFQQAYEVLQNDFIRFYLARTYTALNQCESALSHFEAMSERLPSAPREQRRQDEVRCRLRLAAGYLDGYRCHESLETLKPIDRQLKLPDNRRKFAALQATAKQCTDVFGTRTSVGQRAARFYAEARSALRKGDAPRALQLADKSLAAKPSRPAAAVEAMALGKLGRCGVAIPRIEIALPHANPDDAHLMGELAVRCRVSEGKRLLKGGTCQEIIEMLDPLKGKLKGDEEIWRKQKVAWCRPQATAFPTDTPQKKAAHKLLQAARTARDSKKPDASARATALYQKALKLADETITRRELAHAAVDSEGCTLSLEALDAIPQEIRIGVDAALIDTCRRYTPEPALTGQPLGQHVRGTLEVLALRDAGVPLQAIARLDTLDTRTSSGVQALRADLLHAAGRCDDYVRDVEAADATIRALITEVDARLTECRQPTSPPVATSVSVDGETPSPTTDAAVSSQLALGSGDTLAWVTLGTGAALAGAGAAFAGMWADAQTRHADAQALYDTGPADDALAAFAAMTVAEEDGGLYSGLAIGLGLAGAAAVTVGVIMMVTGGDDSAAPAPASATLYPVIGPGHVGLGGQF